MNDVQAIVANFEWLPFRLDTRTSSIAFIRADRELHRAVTFLDEQLQKAASEGRLVKLSELSSVTNSDRGACHFIFHSAFCCSTLLARALDIPGKSMGLKEPLILNDITQELLAGGPVAAVRPMLQVALGLLARPFASGEQVVIKPSNAANPLIEEIMAVSPGSKAIFLTSALPEFLRSMAKKGLWGRIWARRQMATHDRIPQFQTGFSEAERWEHSDLQVAALGWLHQRAQFARALNALGASRVASLDSAALLANPARALAAVGDHFGLGLARHEVDEIVRGPIFSKNAKRHDEGYDAEQRRAEHDAVGALIDEEVELVVRWAESVAQFAGVPMQLSRPLLD